MSILHLAQPRRYPQSHPLRVEATERSCDVYDAISTNSIASEDILLLGCILFCAFESMSCHLDSATSHLDSGLNLLLQHAANRGSRQCGIDFTVFLCQMLTYLDNERLFLGAFPGSSPHTEPRKPPKVPPIFTGMYEAQHLLIQVSNHSLAELALLRAGHGALGLSCALKCTVQWAEAFDRWLPAFIIYASEVDVANLLLLVMWRGVIIFMNTGKYEQGEMAGDTMLGEFENIMQSAEHFMDLTAECVHGPEPEKEAAISRIHHCSSTQEAFTSHEGGDMTQAFLATSCTRSALCQKGPQKVPRHPARTVAASSLSILLGRAASLVARENAKQKGQQECGAPKRIKAKFTLSPGVVYPLHVVVRHCREPQVRRRALRILDTCNRREGFCDSNETAQLTRRLMVIEKTEAMREIACDSKAGGLLEKDGEGDRSGVRIEHASQIPNHCRVRAYTKTRFCLGWKGTLEQAQASGNLGKWVNFDDPVNVG